MISTESFKVNESRKELLGNEPGLLPCICKYVDFEHYVGNRVPWHWHQWFEINYQVEGESVSRIGQESLYMSPGDAVFINANVLHSVDPVKDILPKYYTLFFDMDFLTGGFNTVYSQKYVIPVLSSTRLKSFAIRPDSSTGIRMLGCIADLIEMFDKEPFGFEFKIRSRLSDFWLLLFEGTEEIRSNSSNATQMDDSKMRNMMEFIENHYFEKIQVEDIAGAAGVSVRECTRCFSKVIGQSPIDYLNRFRIRQAAGMLVETDRAIGDISERCGFVSDSYFGKMFKELMGCTPSNYRKGRITS